jgi:hypothetical protein
VLADGGSVGRGRLMQSDPVSQFGQAFIQLLLLPFTLLRAVVRLIARVFRWRSHWRQVGLQQKSHFRSTAGAFVVVLVSGAALKGFIPLNNPLALWSAVGIGAFGVLYIVAGVFGSRCRFDPMSIVWWSLTALGCAALLFYGGIFK